MISGHSNSLETLAHKLIRLKGVVKNWERKKKGERKHLLLEIDTEIFDIL